MGARRCVEHAHHQLDEIAAFLDGDGHVQPCGFNVFQD
jgi:uncharacterized cupin superfamily protein